MASFRSNPFVISILFVLVVVTIVCTILVIQRSNQIAKLRDGSDDPQRREALNKVELEVSNLEREAQSVRDGLEMRDRELYRLDLELAKVRTYYNGDRLIAGITGEDAVKADGTPYKTKESAWKMDRELIAQSVDRMEALRAEHASPERQSFPAIDNAIAKRDEETQQVLSHFKDLEESFKADRESLTTQLEDKRKKEEEINKQRHDDHSRRATKVGQLEDHIRDLLELELRTLKELDPDGHVVELGVENGFVIVDVGRSEGVFPGLLFEAFQYEKGQYVEKGMLEVIDVRDHISTCRVPNELNARSFPIAKNDMIGNPIFDKSKKKVCTVEGEFTHFNKAELEQFIVNSGGIVRPVASKDKLSIGVDFLVYGDRTEKLRDNAREHQVIAMTEDQLLKYVQKTYTPADKNAVQ